MTTADLVSAWIAMAASLGGLWGSVLAFMLALELVHFAVDLVVGR